MGRPRILQINWDRFTPARWGSSSGASGTSCQGNRKFFASPGLPSRRILRFLHRNKVVLIDIPRMGERSRAPCPLDDNPPDYASAPEIRRGVRHRDRTSRTEKSVDHHRRSPAGAGVPAAHPRRSSANVRWKGGSSASASASVTQQPKNVDAKVLAQINTFVVMGLGAYRGDREIIMGSAKQDLSKMEIEIQTLDQGDAIISTIGIRSRSAPDPPVQGLRGPAQPGKEEGYPRGARYRVLTPGIHHPDPGNERERPAGTGFYREVPEVQKPTGVLTVFIRMMDTMMIITETARIYTS